MNLIYHPIQFKGYTNAQDHVKFAILSQKIECITRDADEQNLMLFGFKNQVADRELHYRVPHWHNDFDLLFKRYPQARIIRAIAHNPLLSTSERVMVSRGLIEMEPFLERQVVRYGRSVFVDRTGLPVYAQNKLSLSGKFADQDYRIMYTGAEIETDDADPILAIAGKQA